MDKTGFFVVLFLVSLFIIPLSFADPCCINLDAGSSDYICSATVNDVFFTQATCTLGNTNAQFYSDSCSNHPSQCARVCNVCQLAAGQKSYYPEYSAIKNVCANIGYTLNYTFPITSDSQCTAPNAPVVSNGLPSVSGEVLLGTTPYPGATVTCGTQSTITNQTGGYTLVCNSLGSTYISATATINGVVNSGNVQVSLSSGSVTAPNIIISPAQTTGTLTINVTDTSKNPQASASVTLTASGYSSTILTDSNGLAAFTLVPFGPVHVVASPQNSNLQQKTNDTNFVTNYMVISLALSPRQTVYVNGTVYNSSTSGNVISGASIVVSPAGSFVQSATATSDSNGKFNFSILSGSNYVVQAMANGFATYQQSFSFIQNSQINVIMTVSSSSTSALTSPLAVYVVDSSNSNAPIPYATVMVSFTASDGSSVLQTYTANSNGLVNITLPEGTYSVSADKSPGYYPSDYVIVTTPASPIKIPLSEVPKFTATGKVLDENGNGLADVSIFDGTSFSSTNSDGSFSLQLFSSQNPITLYFSKSGYNTATYIIAAGIDSPVNTGNIILSSTSCSIGNLGNVTAFNLTENNGAINLGWTATCVPQLSFTVSRRIASSQFTPIAFPSPSSEASYSDQNVSGNTNYCYQVTANYEFGGENGITSLQSNIVCMTTGDPLCLSGDKTICQGNQIVQCTNGQRTNTPCGNEICTESSGQPACEPQTACNMCNRPFGVFFQQVSQSNPLFGGIGYNTFIFNVSLGTPFYSCLPSSNVPCYQDYSNTVTDKYYYCSGVNSCYDYVSQEACGTQKCISGCEWKSSSSYAQLGIGVCRPTDPSQQSCSNFNSRSPITNNVFASGQSQTSIAKELCSLYGQSCYFNYDGTCLNSSQVSCVDYGDNQHDCVNSTGKNQGVAVNVSWMLNDNSQYAKSSGTNSILNRSNDLFNIGICKLFSDPLSLTTYCTRDADENQGDSYNPSELPNNGQDCDTLYDTPCLLDTTIPVTNVIAPLYTNSINFNYSVAYDAYPGNQPITWFSLSVPTSNSGAQPSYPIYNTQNTNGAISKSNPSSSPFCPPYNCPLILSYFSEDSAHNLEHVKNMTIILDTIPPYITFNYTLDPHIDGNNVTFTAQLALPQEATMYDNLGNPYFAPNDNESQCIDDDNTGLFKIAVGGTSVSPTKLLSTATSLGNVFANSWFETYADIPTGSGYNSGITVQYFWECYDRAGNLRKSHSNPIPIDANMIISDPSIETVNTSVNVPISVLTQYQGTCKYSTVSPIDHNYGDSSWIPFTTNTQTAPYTHSAFVNILSGVQNQVFHVACQLNSINNPLFGTASDDIHVTVDNIFPVTNISVSNGYQGSVIWVNNLTSTITLTCSDVPQGEGTYYPNEAGCGSVYYCISSNPSCTPLNTGITSYPIPIPGASSTMNYYSVDAIGNVQPTQTIQVKVDNTAPQFTLAYPFNQSFETKQQSLTLAININNTGSGDVAPLSVPGTYYELFDSKGDSVWNQTFFQTTASMQATAEVPFYLQDIYTLWVHVADLAGNVQSSSVNVIHDSLGPNLTNVPIYDQNTNDNDLTIESGNDFTLMVGNSYNPVEDVKPGTGASSSRVSDVWAADSIGTSYYLSQTYPGSGIWSGRISTGTWPISSTYPAYLTIYANDTLNNIASRTANINIVDTVPAVGVVTIENNYGSGIPSLIKGMNFIVLNSSKSLNSVSMYFQPQNGLSDGAYPQYNVTFVATDSDGLVWVGLVNISDDYIGHALIGGIMSDLNNITSSSFPPGYVNEYAVDVPFPYPIISPPNEYVADGTYYLTSRNPSYYMPPGSSDYSYQFVVNGNPETLYSSNILNLSIDMNTVEIRAEDSNNNYDIIDQQVFVNLSSTPIANTSDITTPSFKIFTNSFTNANPLHIEADVTNDKFELTGTVSIDGSVVGGMSYVNSGLYIFNQNMGNLANGVHTISVTMTTGAGIKSTESESFNVVNTIFSSDSVNLTFNLVNEVKNLSGVLTSRQQSIFMAGTYPESSVNNITTVYIIGQDQKVYYASVQGSVQTFVFPSVNLVGQTYTNTINKIQLFLVDEAGNVVSKNVVILKKLTPPYLRCLLFGNILIPGTC